MNQQQRDLKTNELERLVTQVVPVLDRHKEKLIYGLCAILLAFSAWYYLTRTAKNARSAGWSKFITADDSDEYGTVASQHAGEAPGQWALLNEAEILLNQGVQGMFTDREGALEDLKAAEENYGELLSETGLPAPVKERCLFGLARCREALSDGDTSEAVEAYEELLEQFPNTVYADIANEQIATLKDQQTQEFYAWFSEQSPTPEDPEKPSDGGLPPGHPDVEPGSLIRLPETPSMLKLPNEQTAPKLPEGLDTDDKPGSLIPDPPALPDEEEGPTGTAPPLPDLPDPDSTTPEKSDSE